MTLGDRIRAAIDAKEMKDSWVADGAKITTTTLSNIIRGITQDPSISVVAAIADVIGESVDALLGRWANPLLLQEQTTLREAVKIIENRVLPEPNDQKVARTQIPRRKRQRAQTTVVSTISATPNRQIFTDVRELRRYPIPAELRETGVRRVFRVEGDSMIGADIHAGDILYIRTNVTREQANGRVVVCRHVDDECVKRLAVHADGSVTLYSANDKYPAVELTAEEARALSVYGVVVRRMTAV